MKRILFLIIFYLSSLTFVAAQTEFPVDEFLQIEASPYDTTLHVFQYEKGFTSGNNVGLKKEDDIKYYTATTDWITGDIDGDGNSEIIRIETSPYDTTFHVFQYEKGFASVNNIGLKKEDTLKYYIATTDWITGDIDGDGTSEIIQVETSPYDTTLHIFQYEKGFTSGNNVGLKKEDTLKYYIATTDWITGDIDGDGNSEIIRIETSPYDTTLHVFQYEKGFTNVNNIGLKKEDTLKYYPAATDWLTGDIDGDDTSEIIRIETSPYDTTFQVFQYEKGFTNLNNVGLKKEDTLTHYPAATDWLTGDVDHQLMVLGASPSEGQVEIFETEEIGFSIDVYQGDGFLVEYLWKLDGVKKSSHPSWFYISNYDSAGEHIVTCTVSDRWTNLTEEWLINVKDKNRPPVIELLSPSTDEIANGIVGIRWKTYDADGDAVTISIEYRSVGWGWEAIDQFQAGETYYNMDTAGLPEGRYELRATADDSRGGEASAVTTFIVPGASTVTPTETTPSKTSIRQDNKEVLIRSIPQGAFISLDGELVGKTNMVIEMEPGNHRLEVNKEGYFTRSKVVTVNEGTQEITFIMIPVIGFYLIIGLSGIVIIWKLLSYLTLKKSKDHKE